jgi:hypothetical protein
MFKFVPHTQFALLRTDLHFPHRIRAVYSRTCSHQPIQYRFIRMTVRVVRAD